MGKPEITQKSLTFQAQKIFVGYEEGDNPELEPLFANHFEFLAIGTDIFLDIGILKPEDLISAGSAPTQEPQKLLFYVLYRIAMSPDTFLRLHEKTAQLLEAVKEMRRSNHGTLSEPEVH